MVLDTWLPGVNLVSLGFRLILFFFVLGYVYPSLSFVDWPRVLYVFGGALSVLGMIWLAATIISDEFTPGMLLSLSVLLVVFFFLYFGVIYGR